MKLRYFAWVRMQIGHAEEEVEPPSSVCNVGDLLDWLQTRGANYATALAKRDIIRVAVNLDYVDLSHPLAAADEVALFPPMTGG